MAERAGFEPAVLSHTAFRERHHQPLGHLSAESIAKEPVGPACGEPSGASRRRHGAGEVRAEARPPPGRGCRTRPAAGSDRRPVRQLDHGTAGAVERVGQGIHDAIRIGCQQRPDAHDARLHDAEHVTPGERRTPQAASRLADGVHHAHARSGRPSSARSAGHGRPSPHRRPRPHRRLLAGGGRGRRLGQRCAHVQLVVHPRMLHGDATLDAPDVDRPDHATAGRATICRASAADGAKATPVTHPRGPPWPARDASAS